MSSQFRTLSIEAASVVSICVPLELRATSKTESEVSVASQSHTPYYFLCMTVLCLVCLLVKSKLLGLPVRHLQLPAVGLVGMPC